MISTSLDINLSSLYLVHAAFTNWGFLWLREIAFTKMMCAVLMIDVSFNHSQRVVSEILWQRFVALFANETLFKKIAFSDAKPSEKQRKETTRKKEEK